MGERVSHNGKGQCCPPRLELGELERTDHMLSFRTPFHQPNIPSPGAFRPTVIDKSWPIESIGSRLRDENYEVVESADFHIELLYTLNLWS